MNSITGAFGVSELFGLPIDHSAQKDSTSDSSKRSRRTSADTGEHEHIEHESEEIQIENTNLEVGLLKSYTKIWNSVLPQRIQGLSKSPNLQYCSPLYSKVEQHINEVSLSTDIKQESLQFRFKLLIQNLTYSNHQGAQDDKYLSDIASHIIQSINEHQFQPQSPYIHQNYGGWGPSLSGVVKTLDFGNLPPRAKANSCAFENISSSQGRSTFSPISLGSPTLKAQEKKMNPEEIQKLDETTNANSDMLDLGKSSYLDLNTYPRFD